MKGFRKIPCVIQRGGTSKGIFLHEKDLPADLELRNQVLLAILGSPDRRQIDGLGGADPLTSKAAIIAPSRRDDADVDYTFAAVDIQAPMVDFRGNCGNISSGVGPFAIDEGLIEAAEPVTTVRIYNTNTGKIITALVPVSGGKAECAGDYSIDGVPGAGARILLDYAGTAGAVTGKLLPTGNPLDVVAVPSVGRIEMSIVDAGNPVCFIEPSALQLTGVEMPSDEAILKALSAIEWIRGAAAGRIGMVADPARARTETPAMPLLAMVCNPRGYIDLSGKRRIEEAHMDLAARVFYMQEMHKTYSATAAVCTGTAAMIPGTLVHRVASPGILETGTVRIGHPGGVLPVETRVSATGDGFQLEKAALGRTSRRIMEGLVYVRETLFEGK